MPVLPICLMLSLILCVGLFYSRHRLRVRHLACKKALDRVAQERNRLKLALVAEVGPARASVLLKEKVDG